MTVTACCILHQCPWIAQKAPYVAVHADWMDGFMHIGSAAAAIATYHSPDMRGFFPIKEHCDKYKDGKSIVICCTSLARKLRLGFTRKKYMC